jgi:hypothetical protein
MPNHQSIVHTLRRDCIPNAPKEVKKKQGFGSFSQMPVRHDWIDTTVQSTHARQLAKFYYFFQKKTRKLNKEWFRGSEQHACIVARRMHKGLVKKF